MKLPQLTREVVSTRSSAWAYWIPCSLLAGIAVVATFGLSLGSLSYPEQDKAQVRTVLESPISHIHTTLSESLTSPESLQRESVLAIQFKQILVRGTLSGVRVRDLPEDSVFVALGIRNGDIIKTAYDSELGTRGYRFMNGDFMGTLLSRLTEGPTIEIDRKGRQIHIHLMPSS